MPKKTAYSRSGAQRSKTKQKSFELVRPNSDADVLERARESEETDVLDDTVSEPVSVKATVVEEVDAPVPVGGSTKSSASARMAARRQAAQRLQRPSADSLSNPEHYGYVRKDLIFILILAIIMFSAIIAMHFVPAIGG